MRIYMELAKRSFQRQITYRAAAFAGLATNFFFGLMRVAIMIALYQGQPNVAGMSLAQVITFTGLSQAIIGSMSFFGWYELMDNVYSGAISADLLKPMSLYRFWLARDLGRAFGQFILRGLPILIGYKIFIGLVMPNSLVQWLAVGAALILSFLISFSYRFIINLTSFWTPNTLGIARFGYMLTWFLSGFLFPLRFFPEWFYAIVKFTPFPYMVTTLVDTFLGLNSGVKLIEALFLQVVWLFVLVFVGNWVLNLGIKKLVIVGG